MKSLRSFMERLSQGGEINNIEEEIHWDLQASAICAMSQKVGGPAVHFKRIKGYPEGYSLAGSLYCGPGLTFPRKRKMWGRIAVGLGLDLKIHYDDLMEVLFERKKAPIKAIEVDMGDCQEIVIEGDDVNIYNFPIPRIHDRDGGRYGTSHIVITKDPDTGWTNWGIYRWMVLGKDKLVLGTIPGLTRLRHIQKILKKYEKKNEPMPFAICIGVNPAVMMTAALSTPEGTDEASIAGGFLVDPLEMVKAKTSDLLIPADTEIVIEGIVMPGEKAEEGPFAGFTRYTTKTQEPLYRIKMITHRKNPILPFVTEGIRTSDSMALLSVLHSYELLERCRTSVLPVRWITLPVEAKLCWCIASTRTSLHAGFPYRLSHYILHHSPWVEKVLVLDTDVDSEDLATAINDMHQKAHPKRDYHITAEDASIKLSANYTTENGFTSNLFIDATWRVDRDKKTIPRRISFEASYPKELQERVVKRWNEEFNMPSKAIHYKLPE